VLTENEDIATAATAVRNLNGYDIGSRQLRVDFSEKESYSGKGPSSNSDVLYSSNPTINRQSKSGISLPPLPEGKIPPPGVSIPNAISQTLQSIPPQQLAEILSQLKAVATNNPEQGIIQHLIATDYLARQLLTAQPQLAYATFQAMLMMNLVDPSVLQRVVASTGQGTQPPPPPQTYAPPPPVPNVDPQRVRYQDNSG
jgi:cleavage stimulation factor subunit 2